MQRIIFFCLVGLLLAGTALAEDFWVKKEYMQWSDEEVKKVLTNSPWAKDVTVNAPIAVLGRGQRPVSAATTDVETGGGGGRGRGRGGGGGGSNFNTQALVTLNISWRSALPLRKALVRNLLGAGAAVPAEAEQLISSDQNAYVIIVTGVPTGMAEAIQNPTLVERSTIRVGKKPPIAATGLNVQLRTQTLDVIYLFPKNAPIDAGDKDVEVDLKLGQVVAKKKFNLKDMVYNGKLEM